MFVLIRSRLLLGSAITLALVVGLVAFMIVEQLAFSQELARLKALEDVARQARELSVYIHRDSQAINAYRLGRLDRREQFLANARDFSATIARLEEAVARGQLGQGATATLDRFKIIKLEYNLAAQELFAVTDEQRRSPGSVAMDQSIRVDAIADSLIGQLDRESFALVALIDRDSQAIRDQISARSAETARLMIGLGLVIVALIVAVQTIPQRALGRPLQALLESVQRFSGGDHSARVPVGQPDEIGALGQAFNTMAEQIQQQTDRLVVQTTAAERARVEAEHARQVATERLGVIEQQQEIIREMSVPVLPLNGRTVVLPLIGAMDSARLLHVQEQVLHSIEQTAARHCILDVTGIPVIDTAVAQGLIQVVEAARLLGAEVVLVGIRPEIAQAIVGLGLDLSAVVTRSTLQGGIAYTQQN
ncbi:MAG TPA: STAS domain-containing protein [Roseiflexaceae bacterium]|nr:STAS domain-containing protein [Roseiflexaceae bacterium]